MPVLLKSRQDIAHLRAAGRIVAETYDVLREYVVPGVTTAELDAIAERYIRAQHALPTYKGYGAMVDRQGRVLRSPFPAATCISVNEVICHGFPSRAVTLRAGDIVGIDIGASYRGWVGDSCQTFAVGEVADLSRRLLDTARQAMDVGIAQARPGSTLGDIGAAVQGYAEAQGFSVVREYGGHGVGRALHEEPFIAHHGAPRSGLRLASGMVFTIEPMVNAGGPETRLLQDRWTVVTADGSRSAQFEHTLAISDDGHEVLTLPGDLDR